MDNLAVDPFVLSNQTRYCSSFDDQAADVWLLCRTYSTNTGHYQFDYRVRASFHRFRYDDTFITWNRQVALSDQSISHPSDLREPRRPRYLHPKSVVKSRSVASYY